MIKLKSTSKRTLILGLLIAAISALPTQFVWGQQKPEPSAVIALAPIDDQLKDIEYLAAATSEAIGQMSGLVRFQAQGFLPGVDFTKPAGALLYFEEGKNEPNSVGFFPVKNLDDVLDKISEFAELDEDGDTVTITPDAGDELTLVSKNGYAFVSDDPEMLKDLPADPSGMLAEQSKAYNISAKIFPQRIPAELRDTALEFIREGFESTMDQMDDLQAEIQEAQFEMQMKQMEMMINDFERLTIGFNADKKTERVYFDLNMKGLDGSEMSKKLMAAKTTEPSKFAGFLMKGAAFTIHNCSGIGKEDAALYIESLENIRDTMLEEVDQDDDKAKSEILGKLAAAVSDVVKKTLNEGTLDMGGAVFTDDGLNGVFGAKVVDAKSLESSVKEIVAQAESQLKNDEVVFNLNSGSHGGFNLHEIAIAVDEDEFDDNFKALFGEKINVILGIGNNQVYVGLGKNPLATLKKSIDANATSNPATNLIGQYNIFVTPIMNLVAQIETEEEMVEILRDKIAEAGKDRVRFTYDVVDGEMKIQMEVQDGIFQMLGVAAESMGGMGGGGADF